MKKIVPARPDARGLLTAAEVADVFRVSPRTVTRWVADGRLRSIRTPGGREIRVRESEVRVWLDGTR